MDGIGYTDAHIVAQGTGQYAHEQADVDKGLPLGAGGDEAAVGPSEIQPTMDSSTYSKRTFSSRVMSRCSRMEQAMTQKQNRVM